MASSDVSASCGTMAVSISDQRLRPVRPWNVSMPPPRLASTGLPLKNFGDGGQVADRAERADDLQGAAQCGNRLFGGLLRTISGTPTRSWRRSGWDRGGGRCLGETLPRRMIGQVVVVVGANERHQISDRLERVEVLVLAEERFPLVFGVTPEGCPQRVEIALGQPEPYRHDVCSHAAQPNDGIGLSAGRFGPLRRLMRPWTGVSPGPADFAWCAALVPVAPGTVAMRCRHQCRVG